MPDSTKLMEAAPHIGRWDAIKHIVNGSIPIQDVLAAAQQLQAARGETVQPVELTKAPEWMSAALKRRPKPAAATPATGDPLDERWKEKITSGPADLVRCFAVAACYECKPELGQLDDDSQALVLDAVEFAVDVAVRLTGVTESWTDVYRELTAYLRK